MSSAKPGACEAFIIDRKFSNSRAAGHVKRNDAKNAHKADEWRGPIKFGKERKERGIEVYGVYASTVIQAVHDLTRALQEAAAYGKVRVLRFYGHGGAGVQNVGGGDSFKHNSTLLKLDAAGHLLHGHALRSLRGAIDKSVGRIELHGCEVAKGGPGEKFLEKMAAFFQVPVMAAPVKQHSLTAGQASFSQGFLYTAFPGKKGLFKQRIKDYTLDGSSTKAPEKDRAPQKTQEYKSAFG